MSDSTTESGTLLERILRTTRTIVGVPNYTVYRQHMAERHPECRPLDEKEFVQERLDARYSRPGNRCC